MTAPPRIGLTRWRCTGGKADELDRLVGELVNLDEQRVCIGTKLVDLEHYFRKAGYPELSRRALDAFMTRYLGRVLELADGMRE
ncbi:hypothetical protein [Rhodococcus koreensis]